MCGHSRSAGALRAPERPRAWPHGQPHTDEHTPRLPGHAPGPVGGLGGMAEGGEVAGGGAERRHGVVSELLLRDGGVLSEATVRFLNYCFRMVSVDLP